MAAILTVFLLSLFVSRTVTYTQLVNNHSIAVSSSTYGDYVASRTLDGNTDQKYTSCSHTDVRSNITEAWLRIDLGRVYSVKSVKLWNRGDRGSPYMNTIQLRGYSLRVSNDTTVPPIESSCYTDPGNLTLPTIVEKDCERTTRYIWIYQSSKPNNEPCPMLAICEVQVFGCNVGFYREDCSKKCNHCRNNATCRIQNGECDDLGCSNKGYQPPSCQRCTPGYYGDDCSKKCDHCENNAACGAKTGECDVLGCSNKRYQPRFCTTCIRGMYGQNCEKHCSKFCMHASCKNTSGKCLQGCKSGYIGDFCNKTCQKSLYGMNCSKTCGYCFPNSTCHYENGTCLKGCAAGFQKYNCQTPCNEGTYGTNCSLNCSGNCFNGKACDKVTGNCGSCAAGYTGLKCENKCHAGKYGEACSESCGACVNSTVCNHITGSCELGCEPGWQKTKTCKTACNNGTYGHNCQLKCSGNCLREVCDKTDGSCISCVDGHQADLILFITSVCYATYMLY